MALFKKFFYKKPPDGLLEISESVYVFDCCFSTDVLEENDFKVYIGGVVAQLRDHFPDASFMVFNFREGEKESQISNILSDYDMTVMDYPRHYEGCPLLTMEMVHHFLRSSESWLSLGHNNLLLMHCERGGWPVLAFMLAALLIYRKQYSGEQKTLDMIYKQAPRELLHLLSPLNPVPSQLRYLQYISRRNVASEWPPLARALTLDCVILRMIPNFNEGGGCRPIFRIYGQDTSVASDGSTKLLFSTSKKSKSVRLYRQADCELVKIDIHCCIQGDVVLECISLDEDLKREQMMFRVMFNTAFIRSNILMLNRDQIDVLWDAMERFPKDFRVEVLLSEDAADSLIKLELTSGEEKEGLPIEAFAKVQEIFSHVDWQDMKGDAALHVLHRITSSNEKLDIFSPRKVDTDATKFSFDVLLEKSQYGEDKDQSAVGNSEATKAFLSMSSLLLSLPQPPPMPLSPKLTPLEPLPAHSSQDRSTVPPPPTIAPSPMSVISPPLTLASKGTTIPLSPLPPVSSLPFECQPTLKLVTSTPLPPHPPSFLEASLPCVSTSSDLHNNISPSNLKPISNTFNKSLLTPPSPPPPPPALVILPSSLPSSTSPPPPPPVTFPSSLSSSTTSPPPPPPPPPVTHQSSLSSSTTPPPPPPPLPVTHPSSLSSSTTPPPPPPPPPATHPSSLSSSTTPPPPPPPPPLPPVTHPSSLSSSTTPPPPPPPPPLPPVTHPSSLSSSTTPPPPPPPPPVTHPSSLSSLTTPPPPPPPPPPVTYPNSLSSSTPPPPPPPPPVTHPSSLLSSTPPPPRPGPPLAPRPHPPPPPLPPAMKVAIANASVPPPPPPPSCAELSPLAATHAAPPPPPAPQFALNQSSVATPQTSSPGPPAPPPPMSFANGSLNPSNSNSLGSKGVSNKFVPPPPAATVSAPNSSSFGVKGRNLARAKSPRSLRSTQSSSRKASLKPLHWVKVTRAMQGSLWAETQKFDDVSKAPEIDMSELESLFSTAVPNSDFSGSGGKGRRSSLGAKSDKVHLIDLRRANNCEIMLTKVKIPLPDLLSSVIALDDSVLDVDQVENLIKFCPTKEEMDQLTGYQGDKENLGKCEQFFLELMKVPRVESKLRVFSFKIQFRSQVADLSNSLNTVNSAAEEIRNSVKLKRIMQTILSLGNALNQGTARGSAIGFRLDSLLKLTDTRARNNKMTLMHYLCKVLAEKLSEVIDFDKDLVSLEAAARIQLKSLAEEMQAISKGLEKVEQELTLSENDGPVSETFRKTLKEFLVGAEAEVRSLTSLYSGVGRNADALAAYFGEDPARCPFEQVISTLLNFMKMFGRAHAENCKQLELEKKKAQKEAEHEKLKLAHKRESENVLQSPIRNGSTK